MRRNSAVIGVSIAAIIGLALINELSVKQEQGELESSSPEGRADYELMRLADPATGQLPPNIRMRELAFASTLPVKSAFSRGTEMKLDLNSVGPYNVGGRTRAFAIDIANPNIYLAGGVSGGMWRSENAGQSWVRVTLPETHAAVSCVTQDTRSAKNNIWYYGSGEVDGNSASKSYSAWYRGSGIYKSTDNGKTWSHLASTSAPAQKTSDWDAVFRVVVDPIRLDSDIVLAAMSEGIKRSNDGGQTWSTSLKAVKASYTDISVTSTGVFYAVVSSDGGGSFKGIWRSTNGLNWVNITPNSFPGTHTRTLISIYKGNENVLYTLSESPGSGTIGNSLWKYTYVSGDGSGVGGVWENRSSGLPNHDLNLYGGYCQVLGVKPDNEDVVFVGGTNLYRSTNGFADTLATVHVGGYKIAWDENFNYRTGIHYPDQQGLTFHPYDPNILVSTTDGGIHRTDKCGDSTFTWVSLSNGYVVSQFYGIGIDHGTSGSTEIMGGLQDRGTFWVGAANPTTPWVSVRGSDGAYVWIEDGGAHHYSSTQYANVRRASIDANGELDTWKRLIPEEWGGGAGNGWLFVHPFAIDPADNTIMYLPRYDKIWRNDDLPAADNDDLTAWEQIGTASGTITAIAASQNPQGVVYTGTSNGRIYKTTNAHTSSVGTTDLVTNNIKTGQYTSCIAIDPNDADRVVAVFSNYNIISLWYSEDGGANWESIEGNLTGTTDAGVPEQLYYISDGPSMRWFKFANTDKGYVYLLGTSIGVFSTLELNGDSTIWVQEGAQTVGNVVVDMLEYRAIDQWLVVGTHGNGIYTGNIEMTITEDSVIDTTSTVVAPLTGSCFDFYPNPAKNSIHLSLKQLNGSERFSILDEQGRPLRHEIIRSSEQDIDLQRFPNGAYFIRFEQDRKPEFRKLIIRR
ncbi:MAG: T9SS type A sorting domain-containing protein [Flavobacteriales bacterium]